MTVNKNTLINGLLFLILSVLAEYGVVQPLAEYTFPQHPDAGYYAISIIVNLIFIMVVSFYVCKKELKKFICINEMERRSLIKQIEELKAENKKINKIF
jgi:hypothetical protein